MKPVKPTLEQKLIVYKKIAVWVKEQRLKEEQELQEKPKKEK